MKNLIMLCVLVLFISGCTQQKQPIVINKQDYNKPIQIIKSDSAYEIYNNNTKELIIKLKTKNTDSLSLSFIKYIYDVEKEQEIIHKSNSDSIYVAIFSDIAEKLDKSKFIIFSYDTIFTVLITLLVVILNQKFTKKHDKNKDKIALDNVRKFFLSGIDNLIKPINKEILNVEELTSQISEEKERDYIFQDAIEISFDFYDKTEPVILFNSFTKYLSNNQKDEVIKQYSILLNSVNSVKSFKLNKINNYNEFISKLSFYSAKCGDNMKEMMYQIDDIINKYDMSLDAGVMEDNFMSKIVTIIKNAKEPKADLYYTSKNVVMPILNLYQSTGDKQGRIFSRYAIAFSAAFGNYCRWKELNIKKYSNEVAILKTALSNIQSSVNILKNV